VMADGATWYVIRDREETPELFEHEHLLP